MDLEKRLELIKQVGEEIITEEELRKLLEEKARPVAYDGFEPSGNIHIAQGILRAINISKMTKAGCSFKILVADWFAWMNNKMNGDLEKIQATGKYLIEVWKASGMDTDKVEFVWAKDAMGDGEYWKKAIQIARLNTVTRITRCAQIMGRKESESLSAAQIFYPCMQAADIFHLEADITQLGMDQRKVNMLAREIGPKLGYWKPVVVSHHMLMGLLPPKQSLSGLSATEKAIEMKMSKSIPDSSIFMTDSPEEVKRKIVKAYCPSGTLQDNPLAEYMKYIIFEKFRTVRMERPVKFGGDLEIGSYKEFAKLYVEGKIHPMDLKHVVAQYLNEILEPVRRHFETNKKARELEEFVRKQDITR